MHLCENLDELSDKYGSYAVHILVNFMAYSYDVEIITQLIV